MVDQLLDRRLLEPIDLAEDAGQRRGVGRAEVAAAGRQRDLAEELLIDFDRHRLVAQPERTLAGRYRCLALLPDPDGVDLDAEGRRRMRRGARVDGALESRSTPSGSGSRARHLYR